MWCPAAARRAEPLSRPAIIGAASVGVLGVLLALASAPAGQAGLGAGASDATSTTGPLDTTGERPSGTSPTAYPVAPSATATMSGPTTTTITFAGSPHAEPAALASFYGQRLRWRRCDDSDAFDCAQARVPVDYAEPMGAVTSIALRRFTAADPTQRRGSLFINPGGPGASGIDFVLEVPDFFGDAVRRRYDVIGFDPRGMGESDPVACLTDAELDAMYAADPTSRHRR